MIMMSSVMPIINMGDENMIMADATFLDGFEDTVKAFAQAKNINGEIFDKLIKRAEQLRLTLRMASSLTNYAHRKIGMMTQGNNIALLVSCLKGSILWVTNEKDNSSTMIKLMKLAKMVHGRLPRALETIEVCYDAFLVDLQEALKEIKEEAGGVKDDGAGMLFLEKGRATAFHAYSNNLKAQFGDDQTMFNSCDEDWDHYFLNHSLWENSKVLVNKDSSEEEEDEEDEEDEKITLGTLMECGGSFQAARAKQKRKAGVGKENEKPAAAKVVKVEKPAPLVGGAAFAIAVNIKTGEKKRVTNPYHKKK
jgi:hypothetical protein